MSSYFGTDGIRAHVGNEPFTVQSLISIGFALGIWAVARYGPTPKLLLAHDTRISCSLVKSLIKSGLFLHPVAVHDAQILTSPALLALMRKDTSFDAAIMISASHNPYHDNGIKIIDATTGKLTAFDEDQITQLINSPKEFSYTSLGADRILHDAQEMYQKIIFSYFEPHMLAGKKIVLDCANGAASSLAPALFGSLGAHVISLFDNPNGININKQCGALHTQTLQKAVVDYQADLGFAFDGDGDRLMAVNMYGQLKNGDDILALLLDHPLYQTTKTMVGTIMTNQGFEVYLKNRNIELLRTPVGDKYIAEQLTALSLLIGGEPSGHIILHDYLPTGDGIFTALRMAQALIHSNNWEMNTFTKFPQIIINIPVKNRRDLSQSPLKDIIEHTSNQLHNGRLLVRYSGTEPLLRIMIEDDDCDHAQTLGRLLSQTLQKEIS
jgi:phosphoglucosamine mutase